MKLSEIPMQTEIRQRLIEDIMRRKKSKIKLYCWEIQDKVIQEAFLTQTQAVHNWYVKNKVWETPEPSKGVLLYEHESTIDEILKHIVEKRIEKIPINEIPQTVIGLFPQQLHEDLRQTLQKQG